MESSEPAGTPGTEHAEGAESAPFPQFTQPPPSPTPAPPSFGHGGPVQPPTTAGGEPAGFETPQPWDHPGSPMQLQDLGPVPGGFSPVSSPSSAAYAPPPGPPEPPGEPGGPAGTADPDGPAVQAGSPGIPPAISERPKSPWWAEAPQAPDPASPTGEAGHDAGGVHPESADPSGMGSGMGSEMGLDGAQRDEEAAARRTAYVVPPTPGTLVAGPGVPNVDTRRAVPPQPLVDRSRREPDTQPDGLPVMAAPDTAAPDTAEADIAGAAAAEGTKAPAPDAQDRPDATRPEGIAPPVATQPDDRGPVGVSFESLGGHGPVTVTMPAEPSADPAQGPAPWPMMTSGSPPGTTSVGPHPVVTAFGTGHDTSGPPPGVLASAYQPPAWPPADPDAPGGAGGAGGIGGGADSGGRRRLLLIGGGVAGAVLIVAIAFLAIGAMSGSPAKKKTVAQSVPSTPPQSSTAPGGAPARTPAGPKGPSIDNEKTDPQALSLIEVFPSAKLALGGRDYAQDRTSVNHRCALAARGAMAKALQQGHCSSVVRATYVDSTKKYAVTTGIAVLPTRVAAVTASKAGDPSRYEWFRGLQGKVATKIDQAGGWAASTVRGRYIVYAYAQYADGTKPQPDDATLKALSREFIGYAVRPINKRAQ
jgi:hypothetical protein